MSIFKRFTDIVNANLHNLLEKAEDPEKLIKYVIQEMECALVDIRATAAKQLAEQSRIKRQIKTLAEQAKCWQEKAALAIEKGRDDLAKASLAEKHHINQTLVQKQQVLSEIDENMQTINTDCNRLQEKLSDAKQRQQVLIMRQQAAHSRLALKEKTSRYDIDSVIVKFEQYQEKIEQIEAQVQAYELTENTSLHSELADLEREAQIDDELAALKAKKAS